MRTLTLLSVVLFSLGTVSYCSSTPDKGPESEMPVDGSADSWRTPTDHGILLFGLPSAAELAEDALYHAWTFTLTDAADLSLFITPGADNLDTVMYLYRRDPGDTYWGRYIKRNDDFSKNPWSRIDASLDAGEYRIMVKGYKALIRGAFTVTADCDGTGCGDLTGVCPETPDSAPATTDYGVSCVSKILQVHSEPTTTTSFFVDEPDRCEQPAVVRLAWDYYYSYWAGLTSWEDIVYDPEEVLSFEIDLAMFADGGAIVDVDYGGDEMAMTYVFDADLNVLAEYQHNQSPMVEVYCGEPGEPTFDWPSEDCFYSFMVAYPTETPADEISGSADLADTVDPPALQAAFTQYATDLGLGTPPPAGTNVAYRFESWPTIMSDSVYRITLAADGEDDTEYLLQWGGSYDSYLFYATTDGVTDFSCASLQ